MTEIPIVIGAYRTSQKGLIKGRENLEISGHLDYSITKIGQNTEKSPGDFRNCCYSGSSEKPSADACVKITLKG